MKAARHNFRSRIESLGLRIESLSTLRKSVALPAPHDISERQWFVLESELKAVELRLLRRLKRISKTYLPQLHETAAAQILNSGLGEIELEMSKAFAFFDTYADLLTQRLMPEIGQLLAGCDVLARDALGKNHPALTIIEPALVYCDRGFGASTLREGVNLPGRGRNPMPLIQIPYSRLKEKCNLTSIFHEAGHEAMVRLNLVGTLPKAFSEALEKAGASGVVRDSFALWSSEIGPDFWAFCACGMAQSATIREILALPPAQVFHISWGDPHPPPFLRALLTFDWCRQVWGDGVWDDWEKSWRALYPLRGIAPETGELLKKMTEFIPVIGRVLLNAKFRSLNGKTIPELFDFAAIAPAALKKAAQTSANGKINLKGFAPAVQLCAFRLFKEEKRIPAEKLDRIMTKWLLKLGEVKKEEEKN